MVPNSTVMTVAAIFKRRLLKMAAARKKSCIFVIKLKLQVRLSMQSLHRYENLNFWGGKKSGDEAEVVHSPFKLYVRLSMQSLHKYTLLMV